MVYPKNLTSEQCLTPLLLLFTFSFNLFSMTLLLCSSLVRLPFASDIYVTIICIPQKLFPLFPVLCQFVNTMFDSSGDKGLPCGVPDVRCSIKPPSIIPAFKYALISLSSLLSDTTLLNLCISRSWFILSKKSPVYVHNPLFASLMYLGCLLYYAYGRFGPGRNRSCFH